MLLLMSLVALTPLTLDVGYKAGIERTRMCKTTQGLCSYQEPYVLSQYLQRGCLRCAQHTAMQFYSRRN
jgi:hypothetical protein